MKDLCGGEFEQLGRHVVVTGKLKPLRIRNLGLSCAYVAELIGVSQITYHKWEEDPKTRLWRSTAIRLGRWYASVIDQLNLLRIDRIDLRNLVPMQLVAPELGIPQEVLFGRYRNGEFEVEDLGILGLWIYRSDLNKIRNAA